MMIVVEGPDGAGKTTLIETIRRQAGFYFWILRPSKAPDTPAQILDSLSWFDRRTPDLHVLFDRYPVIGEMVYGPIIRGVNKLHGFNSPTGRRHLLERINLIIYCRPSTPTIMANASQTYQMAGVEANIENLIDAYDALMHEVSEYVDVIQYDYQSTDIEYVLRGIKHHGSKGYRSSVQSPASSGKPVQPDRGEEPRS